MNKNKQHKIIITVKPRDNGLIREKRCPKKSKVRFIKIGLK